MALAAGGLSGLAVEKRSRQFPIGLQCGVCRVFVEIGVGFGDGHLYQIAVIVC